jgi:Dyp-type peroxidase family
MPADLTAPFSWKNGPPESVAVLDELQANIVKAHVRDHLSVLFLSFGDAAEAKAFLSAVTPLIKSAKTHLVEVDSFKDNGNQGTSYVGLGLTAHGYAALGVPAENTPADGSFGAGMKSPATRTKLKDPPKSGWEDTYQDTIDAVILIGDATDAAMSAKRTEVELLLPDSITILGEEAGVAQINANGDGIEHFGYVDGRSQPLFLIEDIDNERDTTDGTGEWDPAFAPDRVLVADPAAPDPAAHFGSYFVFRKLEQNVRRFKQAEEDLADSLGLTGDDRERAGAMLVGRFEDGTPLTLQRTGGSHEPVENDFSYVSDPNGLKCPFHAHIRKTNPREDGPGFRNPVMARRGQTYGERADDPNGDLPPSARPSGGVGLLFMAFNADIAGQFEFTQASWANNVNFPPTPNQVTPGVDPVMGQGKRETDQTNAPVWGGENVKTSAPAPQAVTLKGGEYFFMPSLAFLRTLGPVA